MNLRPLVDKCKLRSLSDTRRLLEKEREILQNSNATEMREFKEQLLKQEREPEAKQRDSAEQLALERAQLRAQGARLQRTMDEINQGLPMMNLSKIFNARDMVKGRDTGDLEGVQCAECGTVGGCDTRLDLAYNPRTQWPNAGVEQGSYDHMLCRYCVEPVKREILLLGAPFATKVPPTPPEHGDDMG